MRMQGPEGTCSVSVNGVSIVLDEDGCVEVDKGIAAELGAHGFVPYVKQEQEEEGVTVSVDSDGDGHEDVKIKVGGKPKPAKPKK